MGELRLLQEFPFPKVLSSLLSALCNEDEEIKWHAVTVLGKLVAKLAGKKRERARDILRRMLWYLNEGSGGIGWGIPEAMGEVLARNEILAREFAPILVSYIQPGGNFLEFEPLQRGALWAMGRLAAVHSPLLRSLNAACYLLPYLDSRDPLIRGHAAWALGRVGLAGDPSKIESLLQDETEIRLYQDEKFRSLRISDLAKEALGRLRQEDHHQAHGGPNR